MYLARCPVCKVEQIGYEWTTTKTGKKWLKNAQGKWHDCPKSVKRYESRPTYSKHEEFVKLTASDFEFCELCSGFLHKEEVLKKHPKINGITLTEHLKLFHPNNEILDDIDFMVLTDEEKERVRKKWNWKKREKKYQLINKRLV
jgi:hypothetical protein